MTTNSNFEFPGGHTKQLHCPLQRCSTAHLYTETKHQGSWDTALDFRLVPAKRFLLSWLTPHPEFFSMIWVPAPDHLLLPALWMVFPRNLSSVCWKGLVPDPRSQTRHRLNDGNIIVIVAPIY